MEYLVITENRLDFLKKAYSEKRLFNYTYLSLDELREKFYFKITDKAVLYAKDFLKQTYSNAKMIIKNIYYVDENKTYNDVKIDQLVALKQKLIEEGLLEYDLYFKSFLKRKNMIVDEVCLSNFDKKMFDEIKELCQIEFINKIDNNYSHPFYAYENYNEEIKDTFIRIRKLLDENIDINDIVIVCQDNNYYNALKRYSSLFDISILIDEDNNKLAYYQDFLDLLDTDLSYQEILDELKLNDNHEIINLINRFYYLKKDRREIFTDLIRNLSYNNQILEDVIKVLKLKTFDNDKYVFLLGFNSSSMPKIYQDTDYFSAKYSQILPIDTYKEKNEKSAIESINHINNTKNMVISFSVDTTTFEDVSSLLERINIKKDNQQLENKYSKKAMKFELIDDLDIYLKYQNEGQYLKYACEYGKDYLSYDNKFSGLSQENGERLLNHKIRLSYSSMSNYYKCQYHYYLENLLHIKAHDDKFVADIGTMFHNILEKYDGTNLEDVKNEHLANVEDKFMLFYFNNLWDKFIEVVNFIDEARKQTDLKTELHEEDVTISYKDKDFENIFNGKIDKVIYARFDSYDLVAVIDYKTGNSQKAFVDDMDKGFNLQLPVYAYLLDHCEKINKPVIAGLYLQHIFPDKKDSFKLEGYTNSDLKIIYKLDHFYDTDDRVFKNIKIKKDGNIDSRSKVLSSDEFMKMKDICKELIDKAFKDIKELHFEINPKIEGTTNLSCNYCNYKHICHHQTKDNVYVEKLKDFEILAGKEDE